MDLENRIRTGSGKKGLFFLSVLLLICFSAMAAAPFQANAATLTVTAEYDDGTSLGFSVDIYVWSYSVDGAFASGSTDPVSGAVTFSDLQPLDDYVVALDIDGDEYADMYYNGQYPEEDADWVDITSGSASITIQLGALLGYITDSLGLPLEGVWVEAWTYPDYNYAGGASTDAEGWYGIWASPTRQYIISAWPADTGYYYGEDAGAGAAPQTAYSWETATIVFPTWLYYWDIAIPATGTIAGHVKNADGFIEGAWVEAYDETTTAWGGAETFGFDIGGDSNYLIDGLPPGTYTVSVYIDDLLQDAQSGVFLPEDNIAFADFSSVAPFTGFAISGEVTGLDLNEYAYVSAWSPTNDYYGEVEIYGTGAGAVQYAITGLFPAADYIVEIVPASHPYQAYQARFDWLLADPVNLASGNQTGIDFSLESEATTISGTISFPSPPPDGASVWVDAESISTEYGSGVEVILDSRHTSFEYQIGDLVKLDDYVVSVWPDNYPPRYYDNVRYWSEATPVSVMAGSAGNIDFSLSEGTAISGKVTRSGGAGVADVLVSAWSDETESWGETYTSFDGSYEISGLQPADDFVVEVWAPPLGAYYWSPTGTVRDDAVAGHVNALSGSATNIDIVIAQGQVIIGRVENTRNQPLSKVIVSAWSESQRAGNSAVTDADGAFLIQGLPASGDYDLEVGIGEDSDYCPVTLSNISTCLSQTSCNDTVEVILQQKGATYTLTGTVTEMVTNPNGSAVADARVEVWSPTTEGCIGIVEGFTDAFGNYSISGITPASDYELTVRPPASASLGAYNERLSITGDGSWDVGLGAGRTFDGTVYLPGGATPAVDAYVFVYSFLANYLDYVQTLTDGRYRITNVPTGMADLMTIVFKEGYLVAFEFPPATGNVSKDFTLAEEGIITGTATAGGAPVVGAVVEATLEDPFGVDYFWMSAATDKDGQFEIFGLPVTDDYGNPIVDYTVAVYAEGYPSVTQTGVEPGGSLAFELISTSANRLTGTVGNIADANLTGTFVVAHVYNVTDPVNITEWTWTEVSDADGFFSLTGLKPNTPYALRFAAISETDNTSELYSQWEANGTGIVISDTSPPTAASTHETGEDVFFEFDFGKKRTFPDTGPGPVRNIRMEPRADDLVRNLNLVPTVRISNSPNVTVSWEPTQVGANEKYYVAFNNKTDYAITKRNAKKPGVATPRTTSQNLSADYAKFYAHVAAEDDRGRIGGTEHLEFILDTVAPKNASVRMLNTDRETRASGSVALTLNAVNAAQMYISNVNFGQGGQWETYAAQKKWKLPAGGTSTVYVLFRDEARNTARTSMTVRTGATSLENAISALRIMVGVEISADRLASLDGVADQVIDMKDAIFHLQKAANIR